MKLLVFSDIHRDLRALEQIAATEADAYIGAGDLATWSRGLEECARVLAPLGERVYLLPGNHESTAQIAAVCERFGFQDLHGKTVEMGRYHVAGLGYSNPTPFDTPGEYSEAELAERLARFAGIQPLVLICHAPPHGTPLDRIRNGLHAGSTAVLDFIRAEQPEWFLCGHIHEAAGVSIEIGPTHCVNAGKHGYLLELK